MAERPLTYDCYCGYPLITGVQICRNCNADVSDLEEKIALRYPTQEFARVHRVLEAEKGRYFDPFPMWMPE